MKKFDVHVVTTAMGHVPLEADSRSDVQEISGNF
jgi:hypothetical protein